MFFAVLIIFASGLKPCLVFEQLNCVAVWFVYELCSLVFIWGGCISSYTIHTADVHVDVFIESCFTK